MILQVLTKPFYDFFREVHQSVGGEGNLRKDKQKVGFQHLTVGTGSIYISTFTFGSKVFIDLHFTAMSSAVTDLEITIYSFAGTPTQMSFQC